ncbi:Sensor protein kinase walK [uncultured Roseburia sp.]|uniref:histidine kinase n=1 Tax=Brotonthovivens ammoniilytica TaxID=2981725 RepID=A0ABT2TMG2_9FIRM|nr:HAMP domain-containing sensor histidine kinase [Brotonthovivens ammoniilytica]MCU6763420.1 HAMP domain-containing histidine kinase [Brotonthovivens ammoniilytica]SCJ18637.1 Sensor protein kinase walK [uncultured Roseburia sp.]
MFKYLYRFVISLRFRFFILLFIFGFAPSFLLRAALLNTYEERAVELRTAEISSQAQLFATQLAGSNYLEDTMSEELNAQLTQLSNLYDGRVMLINNVFRVVKDTYNLDQDKTILSEEVIRAYQGELVTKYDSENRYIELTVPLTDEKNKETLGVMLISVSTDSILTMLDDLKNTYLAIQVVLGIIIFVFGFAISMRLVRPFSKLTKSINDVQSGYADEFMKVNSFTETALISEACKKMLERMQLLDSSRQEFVSNVSHELKTPLTSMKVLADSLNGQEDVPVELYKEFMQDIGEEIDRENKIINDLLSLVKMDKSASDMNIETMNINELLELIMKRLRPIAKKADVELVLESFRPVSAEVDEVKLSLALSNLIENAIKYNNPEGWVHVSLNADYQNFYVKVEDNGIGIPPDSQAHIFERFYRVDKSHSREIGGTGLGLAITRNAVIMHRGAIKVHSIEGEGTTFIVRIPLNYIEG